MKSVLDEIIKLRNNDSIVIDRHNSNRYRLVLQESDDCKTAYYFSTPIYNYESKKLIDVKFEGKDNVIRSVGSNANISISENIIMQNINGSCSIKLTNKPIYVNECEVQCGSYRIAPTLNGITLKFNVNIGEQLCFVIETNENIFSARTNDKCFALMQDHFKPFVVFSCIGGLDKYGNVVAPVKMAYQKLSEKRYLIMAIATSHLAESILLECNLYENKLFQDTTVESENPSVNNVFGSMSFIGNTNLYGQQWLYSKLDYSQFDEIMDKHILKAVLHIPKLNENEVEISAYNVSARFCSFGSNWNNKNSSGTHIADSSQRQGYQSIDITTMLVNKDTNNIVKSEGLIIKPKEKGKGFSAITTGDSYYSPQILEIKYK